MKKMLTTTLSVLMMLALFSACSSSDDSNLSGEGESCTKTADCEDDLRCVKLECIKDTTTDGDTVDGDTVDGDVVDGDVVDGDVVDGDVVDGDVVDGDVVDGDVVDGDVVEADAEVDGDTEADAEADGEGYVGGVWKDTASGLTWQTPPPDKHILWDEAISYCNTLSLDDKNDWYLPTLIEFRTLIRGCPSTITGGSCGLIDGCLATACQDDTCYNCANAGGPAENGCYWPNAMGGTCNWVWSSSEHTDDTSQVWGVSFNGGTIFYAPKADGYNRVFCVRADGVGK